MGITHKGKEYKDYQTYIEQMIKEAEQMEREAQAMFIFLVTWQPELSGVTKH